MNPKDLALRANNLRNEHKYEEALEYYKQSWEILKDAYTGAGLLHCFRKLKNFEQATPFAKNLIKLFPAIDWVKNEVVWTLISGPFKQVNSFNDALIMAKKVEKITSNPIIQKQVAFKLSKLADSKDNWEIVIDWLKKVNIINLSEDFIKETKWSDKSQWKYNYYKALLKIGEYEEIISDIDNSTNDFPQIKEFFLNLKAKSFKELEKYEESAKIYKELLNYKKLWWIYKDYADLLLKMNLKDTALRMLCRAAILNKSKKIMVKNYKKIGDLCVELGKDREALYHFRLSKLIREKEGWTVSEDLISSIQKLSNSYPDISEINSINIIFSLCQKSWETEGDIQTSNQKMGKLKAKFFKGVLSLGRKNQPFCFINTGSESIICNKSILPSNIKDNDQVRCEVIPSYDKKKQKESWKAIKVEKI